MKNLISIVFVILFAFSLAHAQKSNDAISKQIRSLNAGKNISLTYDASSGSSKIFVRADSFSDGEAKKAGIEAMNFGMAVVYAGNALATRRETFDLSFWVLTKKPKFATANSWTVTLAKENLDLGVPRYGPKPSVNMEYLNFHISRSDLAKIAAGSNIKFKLGAADFTFTAEHLAIFKALLSITDVQ